VHVQLVVVPQSLNPGADANAGLYFKLEPGWHIYWKNPGDAGEPPHIKWTLPAGVSAGPLQYPAPKRLPLGPLMDFGYEDEVLFPLTLQVAKDAATGPATLDAKADWLVCQASCIPGKAELQLSRDIGTQAGKSTPQASDLEIYQRFVRKLPKGLPAGSRVGFQPTKQGFLLTVETGKRETEAAFFPADQDVVDNPAPQKLTPTAKGFTLELRKDASLTADPAALNGLIELSGGRTYEVAAKVGPFVAPEPQPAASTTQAVSAAVASTATASSAPVANPSAATPAPQSSTLAVPQITTTSALAGRSSTLVHEFSLSALLRSAGLAFLGGLILNLMPCVFPVLFLKGLSLVQSGNEERHTLRVHGLFYTLGILASFWILVGALLALRAAGSSVGWGFQFQSPVVLSLMAGLLFFLGLSLAGQFEIGLTLTSAGGSLAAKQGYAGSFFTGVLAVVVATPCTAPLMGAAIGYALAHSALVSFAIFTALALGLAAPYVALTLQPAWARLLPKPGAWMEVLRQAVSVPIFGTVIWLAWVLAQGYGAGLLVALLSSFLLLAIAGWFLGRWPVTRWATVVAGMIVAGVITISVFAPQKLAVTSESHINLETTAGWQPWSPESVARYTAQGRPVFVDFTASWCLSCQVNERVALNQQQVQDGFKSANVVLMRADWTRHDESITQTLTALGRSGVPTYVLYAPGKNEPELLPEVLTPGIVMDAIGGLGKTATQASVDPSNSK
jgi:thiol:disulfide interchange protein DsbD